MRKMNFKLPPWLIVTLLGAFLVRIPSFFEPFYYGDEMIYLTLGQGIRKGLILYKDLHDNKPPLLYFLAALSGNVFWFRALLCFWMLATIVLFWFFVKSIFKNKQTVVISTIVFAVLTSLPFFEGEVANAELFMLLPTIAAFYIAWKGKGWRSSLLTGALLSLAALFKIPSIFDVGAVIALWFFAMKFDRVHIKHFVSQTIFLLLGLIIPIVITFLWYFARGAFHEYLVAAFLQNFGYVSSWRAASGPQVSFFVKNGPLIIRGILVLITFLILFMLRKKRSPIFIFACAWACTSLFAATLSERPYPHYFVQVLPSASLLLGLLFSDETLEQALVVLPLSLIFFVPVYFQFWQYSSSLYFGRFQTLLTQDKSAYFDSFSPTVNRNYALSHFIVESTAPTDHIFVWGDSTAIYALSHRLPPIKYVATYHINDFSSEEETLIALNQNKPRLLIFLDETPPSEAFVKFAKLHYLQIESVEGATVWYNTNQ